MMKEVAIRWREGEGVKAFAVLAEMKKQGKSYSEIAKEINNRGFKLGKQVSGSILKHAYNRNHKWHAENFPATAADDHISGIELQNVEITTTEFRPDGTSVEITIKAHSGHYKFH